jgi:hypothetical protein
LNYNENVNFEDLLGIFENLGFEVDKTGWKWDHIKINKPNWWFHTILDKNLQLNWIRDERKKILNYLWTTE